MKKKNSIILMIAALVLASLACNAVTNPQEIVAQEAEEQLAELEATLEAETGMSVEEMQSTVEAEIENVEIQTGENIETEFPVPDDATNMADVNGALNFTSSLSLDEAVQFYRDEFEAAGYTERDLLTVIEDQTVSIVWDGHESGQEIVVQMVDLGPLGININVRLEEID